MRSFSILLLLATTLVSPAVAAPVAVEETESLGSLSPDFVHAMGPIITREDGDDAAAAAADHEKRENFKSGSWVHAMGSTVTKRSGHDDDTARKSREGWMANWDFCSRYGPYHNS
ncbi:hypothetical protein PM082_017193 [Marasmius tenuissimus]|nr:hypothetical protein PM082_017193 [Marasmius tenuissimus]